MMSGELLNVEAQPCRTCHGEVERELVASHPASEVCLQCMPEKELLELQEELNRVQELFVLYSDGITEAANGSGDFFEETGMTSVIDELSKAPVQDVASAIAGELARFAPGEPSDDRTLVLVRRS
ncbi:MAG: SpoIIE family protein phosphatase [Vicinamibacteria bacterium]